MKLCRIAMALAALLALPFAALALEVNVDGSGWISEARENVEASGGGTWSFDGQETVTLNDYNGGGVFGRDGDMTVELQGENTVHTSAGNGSYVGGREIRAGIHLQGTENSLTITGDGSLSITPGEEGEIIPRDDGIWSWGTVAIENTEISIDLSDSTASYSPNGITSIYGISIDDSTVSIAGSGRQDVYNGITTSPLSDMDPDEKYVHGSIVINNSTVETTGYLPLASYGAMTISNSDLHATSSYGGKAVVSAVGITVEDADWDGSTEHGQGYVANYYQISSEHYYLAESDGRFSEIDLRAPRYTLTYDLAGGTLAGQTGSVTESYRKGREATVADAPTRDGYSFLYWQGSEYQPGDRILMDADHTLTAVWELDNDKIESIDEPIDDVSPAPTPQPAPATVLPKTADATLLAEASVAASGALLALAGIVRRRRRAR